MPEFGTYCLVDDSVSIDHVVSRNQGGDDAFTNKLAMHALCNSKKGNRPPTGCELLWLDMVHSQLGTSEDIPNDSGHNNAMAEAFSAVLANPDLLAVRLPIR